MTETATHFVGRCKCGFAAATEPGDFPQAERYKDITKRGTPYKMGAQIYVRCPEGHMPFKLYAIEGEYSDKFECDARCENARGHICKCSCGGINHGKGHLLTGDVTVLAPTASENPVEARESAREAVLAGQGYDKADQRQIASAMSEVRGEKNILLGEEGETLHAEGKVYLVKHLDNSTLYKIEASELALDDEGEPESKSDHTGTVTWFAPTFVPFELEQGETYQFSATVKRHERDPKFGNQTVVTYLETI